MIWNGSFHSREEPEPLFICGWVINISTEKQTNKRTKKKPLTNHKHWPLWFACDTEHSYELFPTSIDGHFTQAVVWDFRCTAFVTVESAIYSRRFANKRKKNPENYQRKCDTKYSAFKRKMIHLRHDRWQAAWVWAPGGPHLCTASPAWRGPWGAFCRTGTQWAACRSGWQRCVALSP